MSNLRDELMAIRDQRGVLTPKIYLEEARSESHPLHDRFEWDDSVAGEAYRLIQAHRMIQSVRVAYRAPDGEPRQVRKFHAIHSEQGIVYDPIEEIGEDPLRQKLLLAEYERAWRDLKAQYGHLSEFWAVIQGDAAVSA